jgi:hypothetical protein
VRLGSGSYSRYNKRPKNPGLATLIKRMIDDTSGSFTMNVSRNSGLLFGEWMGPREQAIDIGDFGVLGHKDPTLKSMLLEHEHWELKNGVNSNYSGRVGGADYMKKFHELHQKAISRVDAQRGFPRTAGDDVLNLDDRGIGDATTRFDRFKIESRQRAEYGTNEVRLQIDIVP